MTPVIDLHAHSCFSDGNLRPEELVNRAHEKGVQILALTDHDETEGLAFARDQAQKLGMQLINGVEISVTWNSKTVHIVGLGIDVDNDTLQDGLVRIRQERIVRAKKISDKLQKAGIENVYSEIISKYGMEAVTRTHFAHYLVEHGHVKDLNKAFKQYLGRKGRAFVNGHWISLEECVQMVVAAGGQAVIAHPVRYKLSNQKLETLVQDFKSYGGTGIEVVASRYTEQDKAYMASIARRHELLASVGSDFHFPGNPYVELGYNLTLPPDTRAIWETWPEYQELARTFHENRGVF